MLKILKSAFLCLIIAASFWKFSAFSAPITDLSLEGSVSSLDGRHQIHILQAEHPTGTYAVRLTPSLWNLEAEQTYCLMHGKSLIASIQNVQTSLGNTLVLEEHSRSDFHLHSISEGLNHILTHGPFIFKGRTNLTVHGGDFVDHAFIDAYNLIFRPHAEDATIPLHFLKGGQVAAKRKFINHVSVIQKHGILEAISKTFCNHNSFTLDQGVFHFDEGENKEGASIRGQERGLSFSGREENTPFENLKNKGKIAAATHIQLTGKDLEQGVDGTLFAGLELTSTLQGKASLDGKILAGYIARLRANIIDIRFTSDIFANTLILDAESSLVSREDSRYARSQASIRAQHAAYIKGEKGFHLQADVRVENTGANAFPYHLFYENASKGGDSAQGLIEWLTKYIDTHPLSTGLPAGLNFYGPPSGVLGGKVYGGSGGTHTEGINRISAELSTFRHEYNPLTLKSRFLDFTGKMDCMFATLHAEEAELARTLHVDHLTLLGVNFSLLASQNLQSLTTCLQSLDIASLSQTHAKKALLKNTNTTIHGSFSADEAQSVGEAFEVAREGSYTTITDDMELRRINIAGVAKIDSANVDAASVKVEATGSMGVNHLKGDIGELSVAGATHLLDAKATHIHDYTLHAGGKTSDSLTVGTATLYDNMEGGTLTADLLNTRMNHFKVNSATTYNAKKVLIQSLEGTFLGNAQFEVVGNRALRTTVMPGAHLRMNIVDSVCPVWDVRGHLHIDYFDSHSPTLQWQTASGASSYITTAIVEATKGSFSGENHINYLQWNKGDLFIERHSHLYSTYIEALGGSLTIESEGGVEAEGLHTNNRAVTVEAKATADINQAEIKTGTLKVDGTFHATQGSFNVYEGNVKGEITGRDLKGKFAYFKSQGDVHPSDSLEWAGGFYTSSGMLGAGGYTFLDFGRYGSFGQFRDSKQLSIRIHDERIVPILREFDQKALSNLEIIINGILVLDEDVHLKNPLTLTGDSLHLSSKTHSYTRPGPRWWGGDRTEYYTPQRRLTSDSMLRLRAPQEDLSFVNIDVMAKDLFLESNRHTFVEGSDLKGTRLTHLEIGDSMFLKRTHKPASLIGGTGVEMSIVVPAEDSFGDVIWVDGRPQFTTRRANVGLWGNIGGVLDVEASDLMSVAAIYIQALKGIQVRAQFKEHFSESIKRNWYGKKTVTQHWWTETFNSNIGSAQEAVYLLTQGDVLVQAANMVGNKNMMVMAKGEVRSQDAITQSGSSRTTNAFGGLIKSSQYSSHEHSHPTFVASAQDNIQVISTEGSIHAQGTIFYTPKHLSLDAWRDVYVGLSTLNSHSWRKWQGFEMPKFSFMKIYDIATAKSKEEAFSSLSSFTHKLASLCKPDNDFNKVSGMVSLGIEAYNMSAVYQQLGGANFIGNQLGFLDGQGKLNPSVDLTYTESKATQSFTRPGPGGIKAGSGTLRSHEGDVSVHGLAVDIEDTLKVRAPNGVFSQTGFESHSSSSFESQSIGVTATLVSHEIVGAKVSAVESDSDRTIHLSQVLQAHVLDIQAKGWEQRAAQAYLDNLRGQLGYFHSESVQGLVNDSGSAGSIGLSFGGEGVPLPSFSVHQYNLEGRLVNQRSGLYVKDGRGEAFTVLGAVTAIGSEIEFGHTYVEAADFITQKIHDSVTGSSFGIGFTPGPKVHVVNLSLGERSYEASQHGSIDGDNIHNRSTGEAHVHKGSKGTEVHEDKDIEYRVDIPVPAGKNETEKKNPQAVEDLESSQSKPQPEKRKFYKEYKPLSHTQQEFHTENTSKDGGRGRQEDNNSSDGLKKNYPYTREETLTKTIIEDGYPDVRNRLPKNEYKRLVDSCWEERSWLFEDPAILPFISTPAPLFNKSPRQIECEKKGAIGWLREQESATQRILSALPLYSIRQEGIQRSRGYSDYATLDLQDQLSRLHQPGGFLRINPSAYKIEVEAQSFSRHGLHIPWEALQPLDLQIQPLGSILPLTAEEIERRANDSWWVRNIHGHVHHLEHYMRDEGIKIISHMTPDYLLEREMKYQNFLHESSSLSIPPQMMGLLLSYDLDIGSIVALRLPLATLETAGGIVNWAVDSVEEKVLSTSGWDPVSVRIWRKGIGDFLFLQSLFSPIKSAGNLGKEGAYTLLKQINPLSSKTHLFPSFKFSTIVDNLSPWLGVFKVISDKVPSPLSVKNGPLWMKGIQKFVLLDNIDLHNSHWRSLKEIVHTGVHKGTHLIKHAVHEAQHVGHEINFWAPKSGDHGEGNDQEGHGYGEGIAEPLKVSPNSSH